MREAGADIVAERLLALHSEPVRHRASLTHGREPFPGALHAFRFPQGIFPRALARQASAAERDRLKEAAEFFIRQVCLWDGATHYQVLGVSPDSPPRVIKEHYHALMALLHPDRQAGDPGRWPASAAQRVNQAYAVLSDGAFRAEYEAGRENVAGPARDFGRPEPQMAGPGATGAYMPRRRGGAIPDRVKGWRVFLLGTAALAALFVFNIWWVGDVPDEYRRLQSATPVENSWRWMRDTFSSEARPRHLGSGVPEAARSPSDDELPVASARPERSMLPAALVLAEGISPVRSDAHPDVRPETPRTVSVVPPRTEGAAPSPKAERRPPVIVAQAPAKIDKPSPQSEAAIGELERLVAELVSHYESGNIDGFVGLFDTASVGVIEAMGVRRDYKEFFEDTESRQLRLRSIAWDSRSLPERAQGEANLSATYKDRPERLDRVVKVELSIAWRAGRPRIAHLSLFPRE